MFDKFRRTNETEGSEKVILPLEDQLESIQLHLNDLMTQVEEVQEGVATLSGLFQGNIGQSIGSFDSTVKMLNKTFADNVNKLARVMTLKQELATEALGAPVMLKRILGRLSHYEQQSSEGRKYEALRRKAQSLLSEVVKLEKEALADDLLKDLETDILLK